MDSKIIFSQIDSEELINRMIKRLKDELPMEILKRSESQKQQIERPIGVEEAMLILGIARRTLYDRIANKEIPHYKDKHIIQFFESELIAHIKACKVKTDIEIQEEANTYLRKNKLNSIY